jgi:hypothetical protein
MGASDDPGYEKVTDQTRAFEKRDEQVFSGAGRGPTADEAAAAERSGPVAEHTRQAHMEMRFRGANQQGEGRI